MSGTSTSTTTKDTTENRINNNASATKAAATILTGAVAVAATTVGLLFVGMLKAAKTIGKISVEAYKNHKVKKAQEQLAYHQFYLKGQEILKKKEQDTIKINAYKSDLHDSVSEFSSSSKDISAEVSDAINRIDKLEASLKADTKAAEEKMLADINKIIIKAENEEKMLKDKTVEAIQKTTQGILTNWEEKSRHIVENYAEKQSSYISSIKSEITNKYNSISSKIDALHADSEAKEKAMEQLARIAVSDAEAVICHLADKQGAAERSSDIKLLIMNLKNSKKMLNIGHYSAAFSQSHNVTLNALEIISDISVEEAKRKNALNALTMQLAQLNEEMSVDEVEFNYDGKRYRDNLRKYAKHGFATAMRTIDCLWARIHDDITLAEIAEIKRDAVKLQKNYGSVYNLAFNRMLSSYYTHDTAVLIKKAFEAQGLKYEDSAYEGNTKGQELHINFKTQKNETVTVVIDHDSEGKPYINVHHYSNTPNALPDRALEDTLNKTINNVTGVEMHCVNPGKFSTTDDCDLEKVKKKEVV